jgi:hypothetical protein
MPNVKKIDSRSSARKGRAKTGLKRAHRRCARYYFGLLNAAVVADREQRGEPPDLSEALVLAWGDAHFARTGKWPTYRAGPVPESPGETWLGVEAALAMGLRGFDPGGSLPRFIALHRGRYIQHDRRFSIEQILVWADAWHARTGLWPTKRSGALRGRGGVSWRTLDTVLREKRAGLPGRSSLARLLADSRGVRNNIHLPPLTVNQIFAWADAHHSRTGRWPTCTSGPIPEARGETWGTVGYALRKGRRGLPGRSTVKRLVGERLGTKSPNGPAPFSIPELLAWADEFHVRTGRWPSQLSGRVAAACGVTWRLVNSALRLGFRGLPGGSSLPRLLEEARGVPNRMVRPPMTIHEIQQWADAYHDRHGTWPKGRSGRIPEAPGETWQRVNSALNKGLRGLPGGSSLARLLKLERGARNRADLVPLPVEGVLAWADAHRARTGE